MSLKNIQLPGFVIAGLYKRSVIQGEYEPVEAVVAVETGRDPNPRPPVEKEPVAQEAPAGTPPVYKFLGNNRQQVVIIVRFAGEAFIPESHLQMLTKMLGACKLNLGDVAIVNDATLKVDINLLKEQLFPTRVLLFGVAPDETGLPLTFPAFKDQEYAGTAYLYTPSLDELNKETEEGKVLKRKLWESLKKMFNV